MHIRYAVEHDPDVAEEIHAALDHGEAVLMEFGTAPDLTTALAVLLAGGSADVEEVGFPAQGQMMVKLLTSYLARCERAGVSRLERTILPTELLGIEPATIAAAGRG